MTEAGPEARAVADADHRVLRAECQGSQQLGQEMQNVHTSEMVTECNERVAKQFVFPDHIKTLKVKEAKTNP